MPKTSHSKFFLVNYCCTFVDVCLNLISFRLHFDILCLTNPCYWSKYLLGHVMNCIYQYFSVCHYHANGCTFADGVSYHRQCYHVENRTMSWIQAKVSLFVFCFFLSKISLFFKHFIFIWCIFAAFLWITMRTPGHVFWSHRNEPRFTESSTPSRFVRSWYEQSLLHYSLCFSFIILIYT